MCRISKAIAIWAVAYATLLAAPGAAQVTALDPVTGPEIRIGLMKPFLSGGGFGFLTSVIDAEIRLPASPTVTFLADVGLSHATIDGSPSSTTLSNPTIGLILGSGESRFGQLSVTLPLSQEWGDDDYATGTALFADADRLGRFVPDLLSVHASVTGRRTLDNGGLVGARGGGSVWVPTGDLDGDPELFLRFAAFAQAPIGRAALGAELGGQVLVSESGGGFGERTLFQLTAFVGLPESGDSHVYLRVPIDDDLSDVIDVVLGVRIGL